MRMFASVTAVHLLTIAVGLSVLACDVLPNACDVLPNAPTPVPAAELPGTDDQAGAQTESVKQPDQPTPVGATWVLESVDESPLIDDTFATLWLNGDTYGGFDGCNSFGGRNEDGALVAKRDGTFSAPGAFQTQMLCVEGRMASWNRQTHSRVH